MTEALPKKKKIHCGDRQHSYVTKHIQEALALPTLKQERILIKTFGFEQEQERLCDIVKIGLKTVGGNAIELPIPLHDMRAVVTPTNFYLQVKLLDFADIDDDRTSCQST